MIYMAVNPENSLFVEAFNTEEQGHDANWIAQDLEKGHGVASM